MDRFWVIVIGGLLPAIAFGLAAVFQKGATMQGVGLGTHLVYVGIAAAVAGLAMRLVFAEPGWVPGAMALSILSGLGIAVGTGAITFAVTRLAAPVALISPITVLSTLVTVVLGLIIFREYEQVVTTRLVGGAVLVAAGAALVASS